MTSTQTVLDALPIAETPKSVQAGFASVNFVKPHLDRDKNDLAMISIELSIPLLEDHRKWVPDMVLERWEALNELDLKSLVIGQTLICNCELAIVPEGDDRSLELTAATIEDMKLSHIEEKGTGEIREITRLQLRITVPIDDETWNFARTHFGHPIWFKWQETQGKLGLYK